MNSFVALAAVLAAAPIGLCVGSAILFRVVRYAGRPVPPQLVILATAAVGIVPLLWLSWSVALRHVCETRLDMFCGIAYVLLTYGGMSFCYFNVFNASETSLHVHILTELLIEGGIPARELANRYGATDMIGSRIDRMIALGQLMERDGYFVLSSKSLVVVGRIINIWRRVLGLPLSPA